MSSFPSTQSHLKAFGIGIVLALLGLGAYWQFGPSSSTDQPTVTVYKSPSCNCCSDWVDYMRDQGFPVEIESKLNLNPVKSQIGIPSSLEACHTAVVENYVVEGHVPAEEVRRLLREKPDVKGLAVPGMPVGSPGMEQGSRVEPYNVVAFTSEGETSVFAQYGQ